MIKPQRKYTTTEKEILAIVELYKKLRGILFGYEIHVLSDYKNLVYAATLRESQRVMHWRLILEEFGPNIQHIAGSDNIVDDMLSIFPSTPRDKCKSCTSKDKCRANKLFAIVKVKKIEYCFLLNILFVQREKKGTEKYKSQNKYINFGSRIRLLHASSR